MKNCAVCQTAAAKIYCLADQAPMCEACDVNLHGHTAPGAAHDRFNVCVLCESEPAKIYCKNDSAFLCEGCDAEIHQSNPLAARHERTPVQPLVHGEQAPQTPDGPPNPGPEAVPVSPAADVVPAGGTAPAEKSSSNLSSLLPPVEIKCENMRACKDSDAFDIDGCIFDINFDFAAFEDAAFFGGRAPSDGVVPVLEAAESVTSTSFGSGVPDVSLDESLSSTFAYPSQAFSSSYPAVSAELQQVPSSEANAIGPPLMVNMSTANLAISHPSQAGPQPQQQLQPFIPCTAPLMPVIPTSTSFGTAWQPNFDTPAPEVLHVGADKPLDRHERVMRYREKRKRRTFEKTIRYQSRKAYAEIRPRIKGRFATRTEVEAMKAAAAKEQLQQSSELLTTAF